MDAKGSILNVIEIHQDQLYSGDTDKTEFAEVNSFVTIRIIDDEIRLIPYYRNDDVSLAWYQDLDICKQVDNRDKPYDTELLHGMYDYLCNHGECYYIEYKGVLVGDVSLRDNAEIAVVICKAYQNLHIGRRCVCEMIKLAGEKNMDAVTANIYSFNTQSQKMFEAIGFYKTDSEWYRFDLR